jgi:dodecin
MGYIESGAIKVVEVIGVSTTSWEDAAKKAVSKAAESLEGITGIETVSFTARVKDGKIVSYNTTCKIAFAVK